MRGGHVFSAYIVHDAYLNLRYANGWAVDTENVEAKDAVQMGEYKAMVEALSYCSENGIRRVWLEDDCSGVIRVVNDVAWLRGTMDKKYRCEFEKSRPQALMATGISRSCNIPARFMACCAHDFFEADDKEKRPPLCERRVEFSSMEDLKREQAAAPSTSAYFRTLHELLCSLKKDAKGLGQHFVKWQV
ncbi:hypothetical protein QJS04_geneDACA006186 [Acorus gramineus]|uniref:RNase H type-1 domain-containing protein n=1 Tax=Acorus gramineus TaxID=55184 RepID=A0AAV9B2F9_ACOGR|nr:hypothetical protein QJS04_geneDACA006186 [Acorus gramineus]